MTYANAYATFLKFIRNIRMRVPIWAGFLAL